MIHGRRPVPMAGGNALFSLRHFMVKLRLVSDSEVRTPCSRFSCELRNQSDISNSIIPAPLLNPKFAIGHAAKFANFGFAGAGARPRALMRRRYRPGTGDLGGEVGVDCLHNGVAGALAPDVGRELFQVAAVGDIAKFDQH